MASTVKGVAERVGLPARTVRYYAHVGLVRPSAYTDAGYGLYRPQDEGKLRFVAQAKTLGLSLAEIRRLLDAAERGCCGDVNPELDRVLADKLGAVERQIAVLCSFRDQLRAYREGRSGRCGCHGHDPFCGCLDDVAEHITLRAPAPGPASPGPGHGATKPREGRTRTMRSPEDREPTSARQDCDCGCDCCAPSDDRQRSTCGCGCRS